MDVTRLLSFLRQKIDTLEQQHRHHKQEDPDVYSDRNLSLEILKFIQVLAEKEKQNSDLFSSYPYAPPTYPHVAYPYQYTYTSNTTDPDTICAACKAKNPTDTHCIHRIRY